MELFNNNKVYNFMGLNKLIFATSVVLVAFSLFLFFTKGFKLGIDFAGGTVVQVRYDRAPDISKIRELLEGSTLGRADIQTFGDKNEILIRFQASSAGVSRDVGDVVTAILAPSGKFEVRRVEIIGPKVGNELREKGLMALAVAVVGILAYVAVRFEWRFAVAAIIGVAHDIVLTIGGLILFDVDFDLTVLAALLMLMGYSINDTIVIFDRIRESIKEAKPIDGKYDLTYLINEAISRTLSRTTLTVLTVFFVILTLYLFGGEIIHGFAFTMLIGAIVGAYSSIFISSPFLIWFGYDVAKAKEKEAEKLKIQIEKERMRAEFEKGTI